MQIRKIFLSLFALLLVASATAADVPRPTEQLRQTVDRIIELLRNEQLPQDRILEKVAELVRDKFDFRAMSQRTLGVNWRKASRQEQQRFVELFSELLEDTYRGRIKAYTYGDEYVEYTGERVLGSRAEVNTIVVGNKEIPVSYRMRLKGDEWLVYDVIIEEVSLISNYRNSYAQIISEEGFQGLLSRMEQKIQELKQTNEQAAAEASTPRNEGDKAP